MVSERRRAELGVVLALGVLITTLTILYVGSRPSGIDPAVAQTANEVPGATTLVVAGK